MIRVVLAVVLAAAIVGAAHEAANRGASARAVTLVQDEADSLASAARRLAARNDAGAARTVVVTVPRRRWGRVAASVRVDDGIRWRVGNRTGRVRPGVPFATPDGPLRLGAGRHRLRLSLVERGRALAVLVRRFMAEDGTSGAHVRTRTGESLSVRGGVRRRPVAGRGGRLPRRGPAGGRAGLPGDRDRGAPRP